MPVPSPSLNIKNAVAGCLLVASPVMLMAIVFAVVMAKASRDVANAREEFMRTVKPEELRAWVLEQWQKYPGGEFSFESVKEWPANFPQFPGRSFFVHLPSRDRGESQNGRQAFMAWDFRDKTFIVRVFFHADGSPARQEDRQEWAEGISLEILWGR